MFERTAVLVAVILSVGCGPTPGSDAGLLDAGGLDAPAATDSGDAGGVVDAGAVDTRGAVDTGVGDGGGSLRWTRMDVLDQYCTPVVEARCDAVAACAGRCEATPCDRDFELMRCMESFDLHARFATFFDGARLLALRAIREADFASCTRPTDVLIQTDVFASIVEGSIAEGFGCSSPSVGVGVIGPGFACSPPPEVGAACTHVCLLPARCDGGRCVVPAAEGASCDTDSGCAVPLRCIEGRCAALASPGSSCTSDLACAPGAACVGGTCTVGECGLDGGCGYDARCSASGTCGAQRVAGERCAIPADCVDGLSCRLSDLTCQPAPALGERCDGFVPSDIHFRDVCVAGAYCTGTVCESQVPLGATCVPGPIHNCASGGRCSLAGTCEARPADGQPCADLYACGPDSFCGVASTAVCAPRPGLGENCADVGGGLGYCAAGLVCSGPPPGTCLPGAGADCSVGANACGRGLACHSNNTCICNL